MKYNKDQELSYESFLNGLSDGKILNMGEIIRYNNKKKLHKENVAEHTFYVIDSINYLCKLFELEKDIEYISMKMAMSHDIPEMFTGDLPFDIKEKDQDLKKLIDKIELDIIKKEFNYHSEYFEMYQKPDKSDECVAAMLVKICDTLSVLQYAKKEMELGNNSECNNEIYYNSKKRINDMLGNFKMFLITLNDKKFEKAIFTLDSFNEEVESFTYKGNKYPVVFMCDINGVSYSSGDLLKQVEYGSDLLHIEYDTDSCDFYLSTNRHSDVLDLLERGIFEKVDPESDIVKDYWKNNS